MPQVQVLSVHKMCKDVQMQFILLLSLSWSRPFFPPFRIHGGNGCPIPSPPESARSLQSETSKNSFEVRNHLHRNQVWSHDFLIKCMIFDIFGVPSHNLEGSHTSNQPSRSMLQINVQWKYAGCPKHGPFSPTCPNDFFQCKAKKPFFPFPFPPMASHPLRRLSQDWLHRLTVNLKLRNPCGIPKGIQDPEISWPNCPVCS